MLLKNGLQYLILLSAVAPAAVFLKPFVALVSFVQHPYRRNCKFITLLKVKGMQDNLNRIETSCKYKHEIF